MIVGYNPMFASKGSVMPSTTTLLDCGARAITEIDRKEAVRPYVPLTDAEWARSRDRGDAKTAFAHAAACLGAVPANNGTFDEAAFLKVLLDIEGTTTLCRGTPAGVIGYLELANLLQTYLDRLVAFLPPRADTKVLMTNNNIVWTTLPVGARSATPTPTPNPKKP